MSQRGTRHKIHTSASMRGNDNRLDPHFSDDLLKQFGDDPDLAQWIRENQRNLDSPNSDGTIPFGNDHLLEHERRKFVAAETATVNSPNTTFTFEDLQ